MQDTVSKILSKFKKSHARRRKMLSALLVLSMLVGTGVFWQLRLTGISMSSDAYCGLVEHEHSEECVQKKLVCMLAEEGGCPKTEHTHTDACYEMRSELVCGQEAEQGASTQADRICGLEEHTHTHEACYQAGRELKCSLAYDHQHSESCYGEAGELVCQQEERVHQHTDSCYEEVWTLTCEKTEHTHTEACTHAPDGENSAHVHSEACYEEHPVLVCQMEEHTHDASCDAASGHVHTDACYEETYLCGYEPDYCHVHTLQCYSDSEADVESAQSWFRSVQGVVLTGEWGKDLVSIAKTQLGYQESTRNYQVEEDGVTLRGITRYGQWYGDPYGDWSGMFVSWCAHCADIDTDYLPSSAGCQSWLNTVQYLGYYANHWDMTPEAGDLIFVDLDKNGAVDGMGIVTEATAVSGGVRVHAIMGDSGNAVRSQEFLTTEGMVLGYCDISIVIERFQRDQADEAEEPNDSAEIPGEEAPNHVHTEKCYTAALICEADHKHTPECYDQPVLVCELTEETPDEAENEESPEVTDEESPEVTDEESAEEAEVEPHVHSQELGCFEQKLVCTEEHEHTDACYETVLTCELGEDIFFDVLLGGTPNPWVVAAQNIALTSVWSDDLAAVAGTQITYTPGMVDEEVEEEAEPARALTHYELWLDESNTTAYEDWSAAFVSWCLNMSQIPEDYLAPSASAAGWKGSAFYVAAGEYVPGVGDLAFFENESVGIVSAVTEDTVTVIGVSTTQDFAAGVVQAEPYALGAGITGYFNMAAAYESLPPQTYPAVIYEDSTYAQTLATPAHTINVIGKLPQGTEVRAYPVMLDADSLHVTEVLGSYDITLLRMGEELVPVPLDDSVMVEITPIEQAVSEEEEPVLYDRIYYIPADGAPQRIRAEVTDAGISFETNHFSQYAWIQDEAWKVGNEEELLEAVNNGIALIQLDGDITVSDSMRIPDDGNVTIDLNGHTLTASSNMEGPLFSVRAGTKLTMLDTVTQNVSNPTEGGDSVGYAATAEKGSSGVTLTYYVTDSTVTNAAIGATSEFTKVYTASSEGLIDNQSSHALFSVDGGELNIGSGFYYGGSVDADVGRRMISQNGGTVNLTGGFICGFTHLAKYGPNGSGEDSFGSAIKSSGATLNISQNVVIAANQSPGGGAVYIKGGTLNISGGVLSGNTANGTSGDDSGAGSINNRYGGGAVLADGSRVNMSGGYVTNNRAETANYNCGGGGILLENGTTMNLTGGWVTNNYSGGGGGGIRTRHWNANSLFIRGGFICHNYAERAEGGGVAVDNVNSYCEVIADRPTYINNNTTVTTEHWGGGGLFVANGSTMKVECTYVSGNHADGFGGGIAGCSTGRITTVIKNGTAIINNTAAGTRLSGAGSAKGEDHQALLDKVFMESGYQDYFCAHSSLVSGGMLGGNPAYYEGSVDGVHVENVGMFEILTSAYRIGLTAHPTAEAIAAAQAEAKVFIHGNTSYTHGGGILANGYLLVGDTTDFKVGDSLNLTAHKELVDQNGTPLPIFERQFTFIVEDAEGKVVARGISEASTPEADPPEEDLPEENLPEENLPEENLPEENLPEGNALEESTPEEIISTVVFDNSLAFNEAGTFVFYISEVPSSGTSIATDSVKYKMTVTVEEEEMSISTGEHAVFYTRYKISNVTLEKSVNNGRTYELVHSEDITYAEDYRVEFKPAALKFKNTFTEEPISVAVNKVWVGTDAGELITVVLYQTAIDPENGRPLGEPIAVEDPITLSTSNGWHGEWEELPAKGYVSSDNGGEEGKEYLFIYTVEEENSPEGYETSYEYTLLPAEEDNEGTDTPSGPVPMTVSGWVPVEAGETLQAGESYILVDGQGKHASYMSAAHAEDYLKAEDTVAISMKSGALVCTGSVTYTTWIPDTSVDKAMRFKVSGAGSQLKLRNEKYGSLLRVWSWGLNGTRDAELASNFEFRSDGRLWSYDGSDNWCVSYNSGDGFRVYQDEYNNPARVYKRVTGMTMVSPDEIPSDPISGNTEVTITNTKIDDALYNLNVTKVSSEDADLKLDGVEFMLRRGTNTIVFTLESPGNYQFAGVVPSSETIAEGLTKDLVTAGGGSLSLTGLPAGTYTLIEKEAPDGYKLAPNTTIILNKGSKDLESGATTAEITVVDEVEKLPISVTVVKKWEGNAVPVPVTVRLNQTKKNIRTQETSTIEYGSAVLSAENGFTYVWYNLPSFGDDGVNKYVYSYDPVEKDVPSGYYVANKETENGQGQNLAVWVPAASLEGGKSYILVSPNGAHAMYVPDEHNGEEYTVSGKSIARISDPITIRGEEYSNFYLSDSVQPEMLFSLAEAHERFLMRNNRYGANLKVGNNILSSSTSDWTTSSVKLEGGYLMGRYGSANENLGWCYIVYQDGRFTTSDSPANAVKLYTQVVGDLTQDTTVTITNGTSSDFYFRNLELRKVSSLDHYVKLNSAIFELRRGDEALAFTFNAYANAYEYAANPETAENPVTQLTTADVGCFKATGIPGGTYKLVETTAPAGYELAEDRWINLTGGDETVEIMVEDVPIKKEISVAVIKNWLGVAEEPITVQLIQTKTNARNNRPLLPGTVYHDEENGIVGEITLNSDNKWRNLWEHLPTVGVEDGVQYFYTYEVVEVGEKFRVSSVTTYDQQFDPNPPAPVPEGTPAAGTPIWVKADSLASENMYILVSQDGTHVLDMKEAHVNSALTSNDVSPITLQRGSVKAGGRTYTQWYPNSDGMRYQIFTGVKDSASRFVLQSPRQGYLCVMTDNQSSENTKPILLAARNNRDWTSTFAIDYAGLKGTVDDAGNSKWRYIVFDDSKFTVSDSSNKAVQVYMLATVDAGPSPEYVDVDQLVTITNRPWINFPIYELPQTGGVGTAPYTLGGLLILALVTVLVYIQTKRRREEQSSR